MRENTIYNGQQKTLKSTYASTQTYFHHLSYNEPAICLYQGGNSIKWLNHCLALALHEIKHLASGLNANKTLGFASRFISISVAWLCFLSHETFMEML